MPLTGEYEPSPSEWARTQAEEYEASNGERNNRVGHAPIVVVTSVGARSGKLRKTPLIRVEHEGEYLAVASQGGAPTHPQWYHNLVTSPFVEVQDMAERRDYAVRELDGPERDAWWERAVAAWPAYEEYQQNTERRIPLLLLTPLPRQD